MRHPVLAALALLLAPAASGQDPFAPGERWHFQAPAAAPWVPSSVALAGAGEWVWLGTQGLQPGARLLDVRGSGSRVARFEELLQGALQVQAVASERADRLWQVAQYSGSPAGSLKRTEVTGFDPLAAVSGGAFAPLWTYDPGFLTRGPARALVDRAGEELVLAVWDSNTDELQIDRLLASSGALVSQIRVPAVALDGMDLAEDTGRVVVTAGTLIYVVDASGAIVHTEVLASATNTVSLSPDGRWLAVGGIGSLHLWRASAAGGYGLARVVTAGPGWVATSADLSFNARTLAIGWWDYVGGVDARLEIWDGSKGTLLGQIARVGSSVQDLPGQARVTRNGQRVAFGTWGNGSDPEAVLVSRNGTLLAEVDVPGSVQALALDAQGTRLLVAYKDVHNNQFGSTGGVRLFDTGERTVQLLATPQVGATSDFAIRMEGASVGFLLLGERRARAQRIAGVSGGLWLERDSLDVHVSATDASGRADFALPIAQDPSLIGTQFAAQAAFRTSGGTHIAPFVIEPLILD